MSRDVVTVHILTLMKKAVLFAIVLLSLTACGPTYLMEEEQSVAAVGWSYEDSKDFSFNIQDTSQLYGLHLRLGHSPDFFTQNVYIKVYTTFPNGEELEEEVSLQLADKYGQWYGDCTETNCQIDIPIQPIAFFEQAGTYKISIAQHSRQTPLLGVNNVGFAVEVLDELPER